jgi:hypothetical protein
MLALILLNVGEFRPKFRPKFTNKNSSDKEGLTQKVSPEDAERIIDTIRSCDRDEG